MACDDGQDGYAVDSVEIERLFAELETCGLERLHPVEREILCTLRERPLRTWCRYQRLMLLGLHAKAHGRPFTHLLGRE